MSAKKPASSPKPKTAKTMSKEKLSTMESKDLAKLATPQTIAELLRRNEWQGDVITEKNRWIDNFQSRIDELKDENKRLKTSFDKELADNQALSEQLQVSDRSRAELTRQLADTRSVLARREGEYQAERAVAAREKHQREAVEGVIGLMVDRLAGAIQGAR